MIHFGPTERFNCFGENVLCYSNVNGGLSFLCLSTNWRQVRLSCWVITCGSIACLGSIIVHANYALLDGDSCQILCRPSGDRLIVRLGCGLLKFVKLGWADVLSGTPYSLQDAVAISQHYDTLNRDVIIHARLEITHQLTVRYACSLSNVCIYGLPLVLVGCEDGVLWCCTWKGDLRVGLRIPKEHAFVRACPAVAGAVVEGGGGQSAPFPFRVTETVPLHMANAGPASPGREAAPRFTSDDEEESERSNAVELCLWNDALNVGIALHTTDGSASLLQFSYQTAALNAEGSRGADSASVLDNAKLLAYKNLLDIGHFVHSTRFYPAVPTLASGDRGGRAPDSELVLSAWVRIESVYTSLMPVPVTEPSKPPHRPAQAAGENERMSKPASIGTSTSSCALSPVWKCVGIVRTKELPAGGEGERDTERDLKQRNCRFSIVVFVLRQGSRADADFGDNNSNGDSTNNGSTEHFGVSFEPLQLLPLWNSCNVYEYLRISHEIRLSVAVLGGNKGGHRRGGYSSSSGAEPDVVGADSSAIMSAGGGNESLSVVFVFLGTSYPITCHNADNLHAIFSSVVLKLSSVSSSPSSYKKVKVAVPMTTAERRRCCREHYGTTLGRGKANGGGSPAGGDSDNDSSSEGEDSDESSEGSIAQSELNGAGLGFAEHQSESRRDAAEWRKFMVVDRRRRVLLLPLFGKLLLIESEYFQFYVHVEHHPNPRRRQPGEAEWAPSSVSLRAKELRHTAHISRVTEALKASFRSVAKAGAEKGRKPGGDGGESASNTARQLLKMLFAAPTEGSSGKDGEGDKDKEAAGSSITSASSLYVIPLICCVMNNVNGLEPKVLVNISNHTLLYYHVENDIRVPTIALSSSAAANSVVRARSGSATGSGRKASRASLTRETSMTSSSSRTHSQSDESMSLHSGVALASMNAALGSPARAGYIRGRSYGDIAGGSDYGEFDLDYDDEEDEDDDDDEDDATGASVRHGVSNGMPVGKAAAKNEDIELTWHETAGNVSGNSGVHTNVNDIYEDAKYLKRIKLPDRLLAEVVGLQFRLSKNFATTVQQQARSICNYAQRGEESAGFVCNVFNSNVSIYGCLAVSMSSCNNYLICYVDYSSLPGGKARGKGQEAEGGGRSADDDMGDAASSNGSLWVYSMRSMHWKIIAIVPPDDASVSLPLPLVPHLVCDDTLVARSRGALHFSPHVPQSPLRAALSNANARRKWDFANGVALTCPVAASSAPSGEISSELLCVIGSHWYRDHTLLLVTYRRVTYPAHPETMSAAEAIAARLRPQKKHSTEEEAGTESAIFMFLEIVSREVNRPHAHAGSKAAGAGGVGASRRGGMGAGRGGGSVSTPVVHRLVQLPRYFNCSTEVSFLDVVTDTRNEVCGVEEAKARGGGRDRDVSSSKPADVEGPRAESLDQHFVVMLSDGYRVLGLRVTAHATAATAATVDGGEAHVHAHADSGRADVGAQPSEIQHAAPLRRASSTLARQVAPAATLTRSATATAMPQRSFQDVFAKAATRASASSPMTPTADAPSATSNKGTPPPPQFKSKLQEEYYHMVQRQKQKAVQQQAVLQRALHGGKDAMGAGAGGTALTPPQVLAQARTSLLPQGGRSAATSVNVTPVASPMRGGAGVSPLAMLGSYSGALGRLLASNAGDAVASPNVPHSSSPMPSAANPHESAPGVGAGAGGGSESRGRGVRFQDAGNGDSPASVSGTTLALQSLLFQPVAYSVSALWDVDLRTQLEVYRHLNSEVSAALSHMVDSTRVNTAVNKGLSSAATSSNATPSAPAAAAPPSSSEDKGLQVLLPVRQLCGMMFIPEGSSVRAHAVPVEAGGRNGRPQSKFGLVLRDAANRVFIVDPAPAVVAAAQSKVPLDGPGQRHPCRLLTSGCVQSIVRFQDDWRGLLGSTHTGGSAAAGVGNATGAGTSRGTCVGDDQQQMLFDRLYCSISARKEAHEGAGAGAGAVSAVGGGAPASMGGDVLLLQAADHVSVPGGGSSLQRSQLLIPFPLSALLEELQAGTQPAFSPAAAPAPSLSAPASVAGAADVPGVGMGSIVDHCVLVDLPAFSIFSPLLPTASSASAGGVSKVVSKSKTAAATAIAIGSSVARPRKVEVEEPEERQRAPRRLSSASISSMGSSLHQAGPGSGSGKYSAEPSPHKAAPKPRPNRVDEDDDAADHRIIVPWEEYQGVYFGQYSAGLASSTGAGAGGGGMWLGLLPSTLVLPHHAAPHITRHIHPAISVCIKAESMACNVYEALLSFRRRLQLLQIKHRKVQEREESLDKLREAAHIALMGRGTGSQPPSQAQSVAGSGPTSVSREESVWKKSGTSSARGRATGARSSALKRSSVTTPALATCAAPSILLQLLKNSDWWRGLLRVTTAVASAHPSTLSLLTHYLEMKIKTVSDYRGFSSAHPEYVSLLSTVVSSRELHSISSMMQAAVKETGEASQVLVPVAPGCSPVGTTTKLLLLEIVSRLTRKLEPGLRNKLFPITYSINTTALQHGAAGLAAGIEQGTPLPGSITPLVAFAYCLRTSQLQHASRLLTLACDTVGEYCSVSAAQPAAGAAVVSPDDDPSVATLCLVLSLELLYESLRHMSLSIAIESFAFCIRLEAMILETVGMGLGVVTVPSPPKPALAQGQAQVPPELKANSKLPQPPQEAAVTPLPSARDNANPHGSDASWQWGFPGLRILSEVVQAAGSPVGDASAGSGTLYDADTGTFIPSPTPTKAAPDTKEAVPVRAAVPKAQHSYAWTALGSLEHRFSATSLRRPGVTQLQALFILPKLQMYEARLARIRKAKGDKAAAASAAAVAANMDASVDHGLSPAALRDVDVEVEDHDREDDAQDLQHLQSYYYNFSLSAELMVLVCEELLATDKFHCCALVVLNVISRPLVNQVLSRKLADVLSSRASRKEAAVGMDTGLVRRLLVSLRLAPRASSSRLKKAAAQGTPSSSGSGACTATSNASMLVGTREQFNYATASMSCTAARCKCEKEMYVAAETGATGVRDAGRSPPALVSCDLASRIPASAAASGDGSDELSLLPVGRVRQLFCCSAPDAIEDEEVAAEDQWVQAAFSSSSSAAAPSTPRKSKSSNAVWEAGVGVGAGAASSQPTSLFDMSLQLLETLSQTTAWASNNRLEQREQDQEEDGDDEDDGRRNQVQRIKLSHKKLVHGLCVALLLTGRVMEAATLVAVVLQQFDIAAALISIGIWRCNSAGTRGKAAAGGGGGGGAGHVNSQDVGVLLQFLCNIHEYGQPHYYFHLTNAAGEGDDDGDGDGEAVKVDEEALASAALRISLIRQMRELQGKLKQRSEDAEGSSSSSTLEEFALVLGNSCMVQLKMDGQEKRKHAK